MGALLSRDLDGDYCPPCLSPLSSRGLMPRDKFQVRLKSKNYLQKKISRKNVSRTKKTKKSLLKRKPVKCQRQPRRSTKVVRSKSLSKLLKHNGTPKSRKSKCLAKSRSSHSQCSLNARKSRSKVISCKSLPRIRKCVNKKKLVRNK